MNIQRCASIELCYHYTIQKSDSIMTDSFDQYVPAWYSPVTMLLGRNGLVTKELVTIDP
jgi:hypothetical protein